MPPVSAAVSLSGLATGRNKSRERKNRARAKVFLVNSSSRLKEAGLKTAMLAAAVSKLCGYRFAPSEDNPYIHGVNNVGGFLFVTTQYINAPFLGQIARHFADTQSLVICASAFQLGIKNNFPNIKLRKIPQSVLSKCEYGADNYNLNVLELPDFDEKEEDFEDAE